MKIHLKKVLVSLLVIVGFVFYAIYQRYFISQSAMVTNPPPDTAADQNTSETVSTATVSQAETVPPADTPATLAGTSSGGTSAATATTAENALYKDGQYDGNTADAYYGLVQVRAIIQGGKLTDVQFLSYPNDRSKSIQINTYAMPKLKAEAIKAQSAKVNIVTGATNTSRAFINSLTNALSQAQV
jgi:Uncharacterized protein conserved in bacteria